MRRREVIGLLAAAAAARPIAAHGQQPAMPVIGFLHSASPSPFTYLVQAFRQGLKEAGFVEGENIAIDYRWAEGQNSRLSSLAADLARRQVAVIVAAGPSATQAAKATTTTIPIVFLVGTDPVQSGLVASLNRPGGNLTGIGMLINVLAPKQLELLHELIPKARVIGVLVNPDNPSTETDTRALAEAAAALGVQLLVLNQRTESDVDAAFAVLVQSGADGLIVISDPINIDHRDQIVTLAARHAVPAIYPERNFPPLGGLMSYGTSLPDAYRGIGAYAGKILKGARPADLPVQQAVKIELIINLKTAKALGITFPLTLLGRADEVIE
jgi:putative ABC transport system substrate-binding protein